MKKAELFMRQLKSSSNEKDTEIILYSLLEDIYKLLGEIYKCNTEEQAGIYFDYLEVFQGLLAIVAFEYNIKLPQELSKILRDCDRLDDKDVRTFLFNEIKNGTYCLKSDKLLWY